MQDVVIFGYEGCRWCKAAEIFFNSLHIPFTYRDVKADPAAKEELYARLDFGCTVPQIFVGDDHIGGYDQLNDAFHAGRLPVTFGK